MYIYLASIDLKTQVFLIIEVLNVKKIDCFRCKFGIKISVR